MGREEDEGERELKGGKGAYVIKRIFARGYLIDCDAKTVDVCLRRVAEPF